MSIPLFHRLKKSVESSSRVLKVYFPILTILKIFPLLFFRSVGFSNGMLMYNRFLKHFQGARSSGSNFADKPRYLQFNAFQIT